MAPGPYDTVEEPLGSGGHVAKDLRGARRWTLDVHAVVGAPALGVFDHHQQKVP